jgi:hypothetical protein
VGNSILISTKKVLGLSENYTAFDLDIVNYINSALSVLNQLGVGSENGFFVEDELATWADLSLPANQLSLVKTYIFLKARMLFDPPATSFVLDAMNNQIKEYEWRLNIFREGDVA